MPGKEIVDMDQEHTSRKRKRHMPDAAGDATASDVRPS